jgi:hypothetical protein
MKLGPPFALVAAAPFVLLGRPLEALLAALAMGAAGAALRGRVGWRGLGCATTVLGGIAGMLVGSFASGVLLGLVAMFPLRLVTFAAEGGFARRGSLVDALDVRQAWMVAAVMVTIVPAPFVHRLVGASYVNTFGLLVVMWVTAADVRALFSLKQMALTALAGQPAPLAPVSRNVPISDVGVGGQQHELRAPGAPYRGSDEVLSVVRGDIEQARRIIMGRLLLDAVVVGITAALWAAAMRV